MQKWYANNAVVIYEVFDSDAQYTYNIITVKANLIIEVRLGLLYGKTWPILVQINGEGYLH